MGTTLSKIIYDLGGGITDDRELSAVAVGGPSSGVLPNTMLDTPIRPGVIQEPGVMLGAGGVIVLNDKIDVEKAVLTMAQYNADESCGKCTDSVATDGTFIIQALSIAGVAAAVRTADIIKLHIVVKNSKQAAVGVGELT
jgi:NADH:ubiquinone oxidoreductase subunit F (NADH-binding)